MQEGEEGARGASSVPTLQPCRSNFICETDGMNFRDWQQLTSADAADRFLQRVRALPATQQRAIFAWLPSREELIRAFDEADRSAPLGAVPYLLKDLFDLKGTKTFAGSTFLPEVRPAPSHDSALVGALRKVGAVCTGKTHLHEFAYGITGENPHYGDCEHPGFPGRTSGGSSSGSAAAVAAGIVPFSVGTDTGGSVRVPAAFCGLYGYRLQPRDAFITDAVPLAPSFDTAGWFTRSAINMLLTTRALVGFAESHGTPRGCYWSPGGLNNDVAAACFHGAEKFAPSADVTTAAALSDAFRPCGDIYNQIVSEEAWRFHQPWAERYRERYDPAVWQRLNRIKQFDAATLARAREKLQAVRTAWAQFFGSYDFLVMPATPFTALTKAECSLDNRTRILALTAPASLGGLPVLTIPVPLPSGLTAGLQIIVNDPQSAVVKWILENQ